MLQYIRTTVQTCNIELVLTATVGYKQMPHYKQILLVLFLLLCRIVSMLYFPSMKPNSYHPEVLVFGSLKKEFDLQNKNLFFRTDIFWLQNDR